MIKKILLVFMAVAGSAQWNSQFVEYFQYTWWIRIINSVAMFVRAWFGITLFRLNKEKLMKKSMQITKLSDYGSETFWHEPLNMFISVMNDPVANPFGRVAFAQRIVNSLNHRLLLVDYFKKYPELKSVPVKRPIFVIGFPRTGTSLLFALLAQDPSARPIYAWEQNQPFPPPEKATFANDPRIPGVVQKWKQATDWVLPQDFVAKHNLDPTQPEEDMELLLKVFVDPVVMFSRPDFKEFIDWFRSMNALPFYQEHRRYLQILGWKNPPDDHWVFKSPLNTLFVDDLMDVYPEANFVWMHRKLTEVVPSCASLMKTLSALYIPSIDKRDMGKATLDALKLGLDRGLKGRDSKTPQEVNRRIFDMQYAELMKDPIAAVKKIYQQLGYTYTQQFEDAMKSWIKNNPQSKHGAHKYTLEEFGLNEDQVKDTFRSYSERFNVPL